MEEQLISFKTALLAKEKGFSNSKSIGKTICIKYDKYESIIDGECTCSIKSKYHNNKLLTLNSRGNYNKPNYGDFSEMTLVLEFPTQSLLQKWIRETHKIYVTALPSYTDDSDNKKHYFELFYGKTLRLFGDKYSYFPTYEEALEVGLFEALNLIKNE